MPAKVGRVEPGPVPDIPNPVAIDAGAVHFCALTLSSEVYCWGSNASYQLGSREPGTPPVIDRATTYGRENEIQARPIRVSGLSDVQQISLGSYHSCALRRDGQVLCWGANDRGQIGIGRLGGFVTQPTPVAGLGKVTAVESGAFHSCVILEDKSVSCWGADFGKGTLGFQPDGRFLHGAPRPTVQAMEELTDVYQLAAGNEFTCALRSSGEVRCWGANPDGRLGDGGRSRSEPRKVEGLGQATNIAAGFYSACAILGERHARCWGGNHAGVLGIGELDRIDHSSPIPTAEQRPPVVGLLGAKMITIGSYSACAITGENKVACWGDNSLGAVGRKGKNILAPRIVPKLSNVMQVAAGRRTMIALTFPQQQSTKPTGVD